MSWIPGQIRAEKVWADAITIDGRKEWICKFFSRPMCGPSGVAGDVSLTSQQFCKGRVKGIWFSGTGTRKGGGKSCKRLRGRGQNFCRSTRRCRRGHRSCRASRKREEAPQGRKHQGERQAETQSRDGGAEGTLPDMIQGLVRKIGRQSEGSRGEESRGSCASQSNGCCFDPSVWEQVLASGATQAESFIQFMPQEYCRRFRTSDALEQWAGEEEKEDWEGDWDDEKAQSGW